jgi:hypothetical protein
MKVPSPCLMRWEPNISTPSALSTQYLVLALSSTFAGIPSIFFEKSVNFAPPQLRFFGSQKSSSASLFRALKSCKKNRLNQKKHHPKERILPVRAGTLGIAGPQAAPPPQPDPPAAFGSASQRAASVPCLCGVPLWRASVACLCGVPLCHLQSPTVHASLPLPGPQLISPNRHRLS